MNTLSGYIPYRVAKQSLKTRLNATEDEIALWVSGAIEVRLDAYMVGFRGEVIAFAANGSKPFKGDDYIGPLEGLHFKPTDIDQFQPTRRFISRPALIERWANYEDDEASVKNFIMHRAKDSGLFEFHPIAGGVELEGESCISGLFALDIVQQIESKYFSAPPQSQVGAMANNGAGCKSAPLLKKANLSKLDKQQEAILQVINAKKFIPMAIPDGGKGTIKTICDFDHSKLFVSPSSFDRAWKKGIGILWQMEYHNSYARRGSY